MFYSTQILARKGPLGIVWMAAHVERKLNRNQVHEASIPGTVDVLLSPEAPLALRLSGQLLLGVCRIYARKVSYLLQDCQDALVKIRVAFKAEDLQAALAKMHAAGRGPHTLPVDSITLPEGLDELQLLAGSSFDLAGALHPALALDAVVAEVTFGRRGSMAASGSASGLQAYSVGMYMTTSSSGGGVGPHRYHDDGDAEMFDDEHEVADAVFPFDLEEVEVERLRAAPAADAAGQARADQNTLAALLGPDGAGSSRPTPTAGRRLLGAGSGDGDEGAGGGGATSSPSSGLRSAHESGGGSIVGGGGGGADSVVLSASKPRQQHQQRRTGGGAAAGVSGGLGDLLPDLDGLEGGAGMAMDFDLGLDLDLDLETAGAAASTGGATGAGSSHEGRGLQRREVQEGAEGAGEGQGEAAEEGALAGGAAGATPLRRRLDLAASEAGAAGLLGAAHSARATLAAADTGAASGSVAGLSTQELAQLAAAAAAAAARAASAPYELPLELDEMDHELQQQQAAVLPDEGEEGQRQQQQPHAAEQGEGEEQLQLPVTAASSELLQQAAAAGRPEGEAAGGLQALAGAGAPADAHAGNEEMEVDVEGGQGEAAGTGSGVASGPAAALPPEEAGEDGGAGAMEVDAAGPMPVLAGASPAAASQHAAASSPTSPIGTAGRRPGTRSAAAAAQQRASAEAQTGPAGAAAALRSRRPEALQGHGPAGRASALVQSPTGAAATDAAARPALPPRRRVRQAPIADATHRPVTLDCDGSTVPATQLRSLLQDRSQLLVALQQGVPAGRSGHAAKRQRIAPELAGLEGLLGSQDAAPGTAAAPASSFMGGAQLAPHLSALFGVAMGRVAPGYALAMGMGGAAAANAGAARGQALRAPAGTPAAEPGGGDASPLLSPHGTPPGPAAAGRTPASAQQQQQQLAAAASVGATEATPGPSVGALPTGPGQGGLQLQVAVEGLLGASGLHAGAGPSGMPAAGTAPGGLPPALRQHQAQLLVPTAGGGPGPAAGQAPPSAAGAAISSRHGSFSSGGGAGAGGGGGAFGTPSCSSATAAAFEQLSPRGPAAMAAPRQATASGGHQQQAPVTGGVDEYGEARAGSIPAGAPSGSRLQQLQIPAHCADDALRSATAAAAAAAGTPPSPGGGSEAFTEGDKENKCEGGGGGEGGGKAGGDGDPLAPSPLRPSSQHQHYHQPRPQEQQQQRQAAQLVLGERGGASSSLQLRQQQEASREGLDGMDVDVDMGMDIGPVQQQQQQQEEEEDEQAAGTTPAALSRGASTSLAGGAAPKTPLGAIPEEGDVHHGEGDHHHGMSQRLQQQPAPSASAASAGGQSSGAAPVDCTPSPAVMLPRRAGLGLGLASMLRHKSSYGSGTPGERSSGNTPGPGLPELDAAGGLAMTISGVPQRTVDTLAAVAASQVAALSAGGSQVGPLTQASLAEGLTLLMSQQQQQAAGGGGSQQQQGTGGPVGLGGMTQGRRRIEAARCFYDVLVLKSRGLVDIVQVQEHHARAMAEASTQGMETQAHTQGQAPTQLRGGAAGNADADAAADVLPPRRLAGGEVWVALTQEGIATTARALQQQQQPGAA